MTGITEDMVTLTGNDHDARVVDLPATTTPETDDLVITENSEAGIYEAILGGRTAAGVVYNKAGNRVTLLATSVFPEFRGKGIAARLLGGMLDELRAQGTTATARCPFAAAFVRAHPEYADVLSPTSRGDKRAAGHER